MVKRRRNNQGKKEAVKKPVHIAQVVEQQQEASLVVEVDDDDKVSEDYCFECKDGGSLIVCDYKGCVKAYHPDCVGQEGADDSPWICEWHSCFICKKNPRYQCYCCSKAVCQSCFKEASFGRVKGSKGLCYNCLHLALLAEEGLDIDSDGEKVDFKDIESVEGLFKEYWDIVKEKEGLTLEDLHNADIQIQKGENTKVQIQKPESDSDVSVKEEEAEEKKDSSSSSSDDDEDHVSGDDAKPKQPVIITKNKKPKKTTKKSRESSRIEYVGWASKALIEFLAAIGVETSKKLSQSEVTSLIHEYARDNKLFNPEKRKIIVCDTLLYSLLKRKTISVYKINDGIEAHFLENVGQSEDEGYSSGCEDNNNATLPSSKKQAWWRNVGDFQHKGSLLGKFDQKAEGVDVNITLEEPKRTEPVVKVVYSDFASIVPQNMKVIYLKKTLMESLFANDETFESKVKGCFVKVKSEPVDRKIPYQLLPVTGVKKDSENKTVLFQVPSLVNAVPMRMLSNDDITVEDCEVLQQKIESGLIPKPTIVKLEKKAKELHEDITKHAIARELSVLKNRIDLANEKGRRAELYECRRRREVLQSQEEQARMLNELPKVIAEVIEVKSDSNEAQNNNDAGITPINNVCEDL